MAVAVKFLSADLTEFREDERRMWPRIGCWSAAYCA